MSEKNTSFSGVANGPMAGADVLRKWADVMILDVELCLRQYYGSAEHNTYAGDMDNVVRSFDICAHKMAVREPILRDMAAAVRPVDGTVAEAVYGPASDEAYMYARFMTLYDVMYPNFEASRMWNDAKHDGRLAGILFR